MTTSQGRRQEFVQPSLSVARGYVAKLLGNSRVIHYLSQKHPEILYLLRGLIKCGLCGLTYVGVAANRPNGKREFYYRCNGAHTPSVYSKTGRC